MEPQRDGRILYFTANRDLQAAKRFVRKALARHGKPERITIDGSQTNCMAVMQCDAAGRRTLRYPIQQIHEQCHRAGSRLPY